MKKLQINPSKKSKSNDKSQTTYIEREPSFYDKDLQNYRDKFTKSIEKRSIEKAQLRKVYNQNTEAGNGRIQSASRNGESRGLKRRPSRGSLAAITNFDIDFYGNHASISHLTKSRVASGTNRTYHSTTKQTINFEVGLRNYQSKSNLKPAKAWTNNIYSTS